MRFGVVGCLVLILSILFLVACEPPPDLNKNKYREGNWFPLPENLKGTGAYLVIEWNGKKPWVMASGNLIDRKKGILRTAKHFTDVFGSLGVDYCRVFLMNGKVYKAVLVKVPPIRDAALIRLAEPFLASDLPEPLPATSEMPKFGDKIYIQGFHPHIYRIRKENKEEGFPDREINIFETYYSQITKDLDKESQVVFDNLVGKRVRPDPESVRNNLLLSDEQKEAVLQYENSKYIKVVMGRDHKFSFGGLSGGVALNDRGEVVGLITAQDIFRFEFDENGFFFDPESGHIGATIKKQFFDTMYVTPVDSIKDMDAYVANLK